MNEAIWEMLTVPEPNTGCLLWLGATTRAGYGIMVEGEGLCLAHRVAYERARGTFDVSLNVCHRCDTPSCVNPDHLFLATQLENMQDMQRKGRARRTGRPPHARDTKDDRRGISVS